MWLTKFVVKAQKNMTDFKQTNKIARVHWASNLHKTRLSILENICFAVCPQRVEAASKLNYCKKKIKLAAFLLAAFCIKKHLKVDELNLLKINGKPFLKNQKNAFFNISHSANAAACATSASPIGVDLECFRPLNLNVANKICCESELRFFSKLPKTQQTKFLFKVWTAKESFAKMKAETIFENLKAINHKNINNLKTIFLKNYALSVCSKTAQNFEFQKINFDEVIWFFKQN